MFVENDRKNDNSPNKGINNEIRLFKPKKQKERRAQSVERGQVRGSKSTRPISKELPQSDEEAPMQEVEIELAVNAALKHLQVLESKYLELSNMYYSVLTPQQIKGHTEIGTKENNLLSNILDEKMGIEEELESLISLKDTNIMIQNKQLKEALAMSKEEINMLNQKIEYSHNECGILQNKILSKSVSAKAEPFVQIKEELKVLFNNLYTGIESTTNVKPPPNLKEELRMPPLIKAQHKDASTSTPNIKASASQAPTPKIIPRKSSPRHNLADELEIYKEQKSKLGRKFSSSFLSYKSVIPTLGSEVRSMGSILMEGPPTHFISKGGRIKSERARARPITGSRGYIQGRNNNFGVIEGDRLYALKAIFKAFKGNYMKEGDVVQNILDCTVEYRELGERILYICEELLADIYINQSHKQQAPTPNHHSIHLENDSINCSHILNSFDDERTSLTRRVFDLQMANDKLHKELLALKTNFQYTEGDKIALMEEMEELRAKLSGVNNNQNNNKGRNRNFIPGSLSEFSVTSLVKRCEDVNGESKSNPASPRLMLGEELSTGRSVKTPVLKVDLVTKGKKEVLPLLALQIHALTNSQFIFKKNKISTKGELRDNLYHTIGSVQDLIINLGDKGIDSISMEELDALKSEIIRKKESIKRHFTTTVINSEEKESSKSQILQKSRTSPKMDYYMPRGGSSQRSGNSRNKGLIRSKGLSQSSTHQHSASESTQQLTPYTPSLDNRCSFLISPTEVLKTPENKKHLNPEDNQNITNLQQELNKSNSKIEKLRLEIGKLSDDKLQLEEGMASTRNKLGEVQKAYTNKLQKLVKSHNGIIEQFGAEKSKVDKDHNLTVVQLKSTISRIQGKLIIRQKELNKETNKETSPTPKTPVIRPPKIDYIKSNQKISITPKPIESRNSRSKSPFNSMIINKQMGKLKDRVERSDNLIHRDFQKLKEEFKVKNEEYKELQEKFNKIQYDYVLYSKRVEYLIELSNKNFENIKKEKCIEEEKRLETELKLKQMKEKYNVSVENNKNLIQDITNISTKYEDQKKELKSQKEREKEISEFKEIKRWDNLTRDLRQIQLDMTDKETEIAKLEEIITNDKKLIKSIEISNSQEIIKYKENIIKVQEQVRKLEKEKQILTYETTIHIERTELEKREMSKDVLRTESKVLTLLNEGEGIKRQLDEYILDANTQKEEVDQRVLNYNLRINRNKGKLIRARSQNTDIQNIYKQKENLLKEYEENKNELLTKYQNDIEMKSSRFKGLKEECKRVKNNLLEVEKERDVLQKELDSNKYIKPVAEICTFESTHIDYEENLKESGIKETPKKETINPKSNLLKHQDSKNSSERKNSESSIFEIHDLEKQISTLTTTNNELRHNIHATQLEKTEIIQECEKLKEWIRNAEKNNSNTKTGDKLHEFGIQIQTLKLKIQENKESLEVKNNFIDNLIQEKTKLERKITESEQERLKFIQVQNTLEENNTILADELVHYKNLNKIITEEKCIMETKYDIQSRLADKAKEELHILDNENQNLQCIVKFDKQNYDIKMNRKRGKIHRERKEKLDKLEELKECKSKLQEYEENRSGLIHQYQVKSEKLEKDMKLANDEMKKLSHEFYKVDQERGILKPKTSENEMLKLDNKNLIELVENQEAKIKELVSEAKEKGILNSEEFAVCKVNEENSKNELNNQRLEYEELRGEIGSIKEKEKKIIELKGEIKNILGEYSAKVEEIVGLKEYIDQLQKEKEKLRDISQKHEEHINNFYTEYKESGLGEREDSAKSFKIIRFPSGDLVPQESTPINISFSAEDNQYSNFVIEETPEFKPPLNINTPSYHIAPTTINFSRNQEEECKNHGEEQSGRKMNDLMKKCEHMAKENSSLREIQSDNSATLFKLEQTIHKFKEKINELEIELNTQTSKYNDVFEKYETQINKQIDLQLQIDQLEQENSLLKENDNYINTVYVEKITYMDKFMLEEKAKMKEKEEIIRELDMQILELKDRGRVDMSYIGNYGGDKLPFKERERRDIGNTAKYIKLGTEPGVFSRNIHKSVKGRKGHRSYLDDYDYINKTAEF